MDATVSEGSSDHRTLGTLTRFLLLHALILVAFHLAMGWLFQVYRQNEFSGLALVMALYASPVLLLFLSPVHLWIYRKAKQDRRHLLAVVVSMACVGLFNLIYYV